MGKNKGENSKATAAKEKKAASKAEDERKKAEAKEALEAQKWSEGSKKNKNAEDKEAKRLEQLAKKAELEKLKAQEEAEVSKIKTVKSGEAKKAAKKESKINSGAPRSVPTFTATSIDDALDLMDAVNVSDKTVNAASTGIDMHPERRAKAAYMAFEERRLAELKVERPGLRLSQYKQALQKEWQKSPENPFNQVTMAYNASKDEKRKVITDLAKDVENRLKVGN